MMKEAPSLEVLKETWTHAWPQALSDWSQFIQLRDPIWCFNQDDERRESLTGSFAMIRLVDHAVVISLRQIHELNLTEFAVEILAHEIGHHVYCPSDLTDNGRLLARIRRGLPGCEAYAPMVANLYADLLINDRLQRQCGRNMAGVYAALERKANPSRLWSLYLRIYELLWNLPPQTLTHSIVEERINQDALLGARLVRIYSRDWLAGAGRFACLLLPYVAEEAESARQDFQIWCDAIKAGCGGTPEGLTELDDEELDGVIHPAEDPVLSGLDPVDIGEQSGGFHGRVSGTMSGRKTLKTYRDPFEYAEILRATGLELDDREIARRYYRERSLPHLIPFPAKSHPVAVDFIPEGVEVWDLGQDLQQVDWFETLLASPNVIPGVTTRERLVGESPGHQQASTPVDLYLGVDCSGSMGDPAFKLSYPVLAGAIICLSALRAGAAVKVVLSGEPGRSIATDGFVTDQNAVMKMLVNYLGTGYSFGIHRLAETYTNDEPRKRPSHILIVSDYDMFSMLDSTANGCEGWDVAKEACLQCGGGATYVLQLPGYSGSVHDRYAPQIERMQQDGWNVCLVNSMEELVAFARQFSRIQYHDSNR